MKKELKNLTEDSEILKNNFGYDDNQIETLWKQFLDNQTNQTLIVDNLTLISKKDKKIKLNKVSFEIMPKTFHVFIGNNGAGKSTTIKCMIGLIENYQGSIYLKNLGYLDRNQIAYVPDAIPKFPTNMTTRQYLLKTAILLSHQKPEVIQTKLNSYVQKFGNNVLSDSKLFIYDKNNPQHIKFAYQNDKENKFPALNKNVMLGEYKTQLGADTLAQTYNKIVDTINSNIFNGYDRTKIKSKLIKPEDIVVLYSTGGVPKLVTYGEFLSLTEIVPKLVNRDSFKIYNTKKDLKSGIQYSSVLEPAKIVVAYDLLGNIVNPGIELSDSQQLQTTSDAIFDSEQTILDNIIRTKIIKQDTENVYYVDEKDNFHLTKNQVHQIYKLVLGDKIYFYRSHQELMNSLNNIFY